MFEFIEKAVTNAMDVTIGVMSGEDVTRQQVAKLIADGMTVAAAASLMGVAVDVVQQMLED